MSLLVDDSAAQWVFSSTENANLSMRDAGWHQLAHNRSAITSGYYNSTALWTTTPGATASLIFQGTEIFLYSAKSPQFGTMNVTCDWNSSSVPLTQTELQPGEMVWHLSGLDPTVLHAVRVQSMGDGRINIDKVGIEPGPPSAIPPSMPTPLPPAFPNIRIPTTPSTVTSMTTLKTTVTMTMTMTTSASAAAKPSSGVSLSNGALTGIILASVMFSVAIGLLLLCWKRRRSRRNARKTVPGLQRSAFRSLHLPYWLRRTTSSNISGSDSSFMAIEDQEKGEVGLVGDKEDVPGRNATAILPSIRRLSTLSIGGVPYSSSPVPSRAIRTRVPAST
ncbi:uncharacterized protein FOMMEDRAFT_170365, partial [Fomitiporia mediterranea MF3/22]|uniref:uncharacterized protein n=1 Tax=Fomitiporia mediterranea (strain MF3/22) TaxID=694068 RepID=UPI000440966D